jgi:hypothetical protein
MEIKYMATPEQLNKIDALQKAQLSYLKESFDEFFNETAVQIPEHLYPAITAMFINVYIRGKNDRHDMDYLIASL